MKKLTSLLIVGTVFGGAITGTLSGCSNNRNAARSGPSVSVPNVSGPSVDGNSLKQGETTTVHLSNGAEIVVEKLGGKLVFQAEGILNDRSFNSLRSEMESLQVSPAERKERMRKELEKVLSKLNTAGAVSLNSFEEVGLFTLLIPYTEEVFSPIKGIKLDDNRQIIVNPIVHDPSVVKNVKAFTPENLGISMGDADLSDTANFSGLKSIHAPEFVRMVEAELGANTLVDGSSVNLGITDTGITYNHKTFLSKDKTSNRISYMRDFTNEGTIYFNPAAKFAVTELTNQDELAVNAEVIVTPRVPAIPAADQFARVENLKIKVSQDLRKVLLSNPDAKLGVLLEDSLNGEAEQVDINRNGKINDKLFAILIPGKGGADDQLYFDITGMADFRQSKPLSDWNRTKTMITAYSEKFGFSIRPARLPNKDGDQNIDVTAAAIVGYDPGNHGSHVAGIAAGRQTILNDNESTLARGVAPAANILMNRVCSNNAGCNASAALSDMVLNGGANVVNMSLGGLSPFNDGYGVQETLINRLTTLKNTLFVISAGNSGPGHQTIGSPSTARFSLSVGASASKAMLQRQYQWPGETSRTGDPSDDMMLFFSSRGPTAAGGFKPNVAAPGTELSSIQLNAAPGARAGLDVYWGTSMAAPAATGAYALFLDAINKYNAKNPGSPLSTNALVLRQVLIEAARPFDVAKFDTLTGEKSTGQYTWIDQGTGMIDLVAAWKKLKEVRDRQLPTAVVLDGAPVELDYEVVVSQVTPSGVAYDGSRVGGVQPAFGSGLYVDFNTTETLKTVNVIRSLPAIVASSADAGEGDAQVHQTRDEFVLRTVIYGSDKAWLKAGTRDQLNCWESDASLYSITGRGAEITTKANGTGTLTPMPASNLNVCLNRQMISQELAPGDHGALIYGYRTVGDEVAPLPSFIVPVYLTVPNATMKNATSYEINDTIQSFGVKRNYITVPEGTTLVRVTLEVPPLKLDKNGNVAPGESCSGVELMSLEGINTAKSFATRPEARVMNCEANGAISTDKKRSISLSRTNPTPGIWDLDVFGIYKYAQSRYKLRVDYLTATSSVKKIEGGLDALNGQMAWTIREGSLGLKASAENSSLTLNGLSTSVNATVANEDFIIVDGPNGLMRSYGTEFTSVTITTGGSPGNDLDLAILECPEGSLAPDDLTCTAVASSGGSTDEEKATFHPKADKVYAALVNGYAVKDSGAFVVTETMQAGTERGEVAISGDAPAFGVTYSFSSQRLATSVLANHALFVDGTYQMVGTLSIRAQDNTLLDAIPVKIKK